MDRSREKNTDLSYSKKQMVTVLRRISKYIENGKPFSLHIDGKPISVPVDAERKIDFQRDDKVNEIRVKFRWRED